MMTTAELAGILGVSKRTVVRYMREVDFPNPMREEVHGGTYRFVHSWDRVRPWLVAHGLWDEWSEQSTKKTFRRAECVECGSPCRRRAEAKRPRCSSCKSSYQAKKERAATVARA